MSTNGGSPRTMFQKIWDEHVVLAEPNKQAILYVDLQLVHEVTSAQAFEGLRLAGRKVRRPQYTIATPDHNVPTSNRNLPRWPVASRYAIANRRILACFAGVTASAGCP